jgi:hypothetical protein
LRFDFKNVHENQILNNLILCFQKATKPAINSITISKIPQQLIYFIKKVFFLKSFLGLLYWLINELKRQE